MSAYIEGNLTEAWKLTDEVFAVLARRAQPLKEGKNFIFGGGGMHVYHLNAITTENHDATTEALAVTIFGVSAADYKQYRIGISGEEDFDLLFFQVPAITECENETCCETLDDMQKKTTEYKETERHNAYAKEAHKLRKEKTRVSTLAYLIDSICAINVI